MLALFIKYYLLIFISIFGDKLWAPLCGKKLLKYLKTTRHPQEIVQSKALKIITKLIIAIPLRAELSNNIKFEKKYNKI